MNAVLLTCQAACMAAAVLPGVGEPAVSVLFFASVFFFGANLGCAACIWSHGKDVV